MATLDAQIDELYQLPLAEFTRARNALAKTLKGEEAKRVRGLGKPQVVPWAINQLYWEARPLYDQLLESGDALRTAQIAALEGRRSDARHAAEAHRAALAKAVQKATDIATQAGSQPSADVLARMLEAISLAAARDQPAGRLTDIVQPAGFEALTGVTPAVQVRSARPEPSKTPPHTPSSRHAAEEDESKPTVDERRRAKDENKHTREEAAQRRRNEEAVRIAERALARARDVEAHANRALGVAKEAVQEAEQKLALAQARLTH